MIKTIVRNLLTSWKFKGSLSEKISLFSKFNALKMKSRKDKSKNVIHKESLLNYKISFYSYSIFSYLIKEVFCSNEYFFKTKNKQPVIIDCGANIGMASLYFKRLYPNSKIIAFEANPTVFKLLKENVGNNNLNDIELHNIALFDKETEIPFYISDDLGTLVGSINKTRGGTVEYKVPAQKLSSYLKQFDSVDLIKIDVEGAEKNIVEDLIESNTITKADNYIIEYHHNLKENTSLLSSFLQKFETNGFQYNLRAHFDEINTVQDILIHFYK